MLCASRSQHCASDSANPGSSPRYPAPATASTRDQAPDGRRGTVDRRPGLSVRLKLTLSYAGFLMFTGALLLAAVWVFFVRYAPNGVIVNSGGLVPNVDITLRGSPAS